MGKGAKFVPVDDELWKSQWIFRDLTKLVKSATNSEVGRAVKALIVDTPDNVDGSPLSPEEFALYTAALFWLEQVRLRRVLNRWEGR